MAKQNLTNTLVETCVQFLYKRKKKQIMLVHAYTLSMKETEAGGLQQMQS